MTTRRNFLKLAAAVPIAAPQIVEAAQDAIDEARFSAMFREPSELAVDDGGFFVPRRSLNTELRDLLKLKSSSPWDAISPAMTADHSVLAQMREHDIFDLGDDATNASP